MERVIRYRHVCDQQYPATLIRGCPAEADCLAGARKPCRPAPALLDVELAVLATEAVGRS